MRGQFETDKEHKKKYKTVTFPNQTNNKSMLKSMNTIRNLSKRPCTFQSSQLRKQIKVE